MGLFNIFAHPRMINFACFPTISISSKVPLEFIKAMADIGLFAQAIPKQYGGLELSSTYLTRMADITGKIGEWSLETELK